MIIFEYLFWISLLAFGGYIYNRTIFWIGSFIYVFANRLLRNYSTFWFDRGTTILDILNEVKYKYDDRYRAVNDVRWIPGINIIISTLVFSIDILKFMWAIWLKIFCYIIVLGSYFWKYILKYIYKSLVYCLSKINIFIKKLQIINLLIYLKNLYTISINKLLRLRIA